MEQAVQVGRLVKHVPKYADRRQLGNFFSIGEPARFREQAPGVGSNA